MADYSELREAIITGNAAKAQEVTQIAIDENVDPSELLSGYMVPAMDEVGRRFECNEFFVPELLIAARAMKASLELLTPKMAEAGTEKAGRIVVGTVKGDLHDIGKNLVVAMLEGSGFDVIDLGVDVPPERFVEEAKKQSGTVVAMSALLTTTMSMMKTVIEAIQAAGIREETKIMVGGAPITDQFANEIGADGYSDNASGAVTVARNLVAK